LLELNQFNVEAAQLFFILFGFERCIFTTSTTTLVSFFPMIVILLLSGAEKRAAL
jgi:hypothetical protein